MKILHNNFFLKNNLLKMELQQKTMAPTPSLWVMPNPFQIVFAKDHP
jgi:hypothetical protein